MTLANTIVQSISGSIQVDHPNPLTVRALELIGVERLNQDARWGFQDHRPDRWMTILMEEVGELAREVFELRDGHPPQVRITALRAMREEAVQVAAVATLITEYLDRHLTQCWEAIDEAAG